MSGDDWIRHREGPRTVEDNVMAALDRSPGGPTYVIADVTRDDAWVATPAENAVRLEARR